MAEVVVTRGGQMTLTKDVREQLRIREGDTVTVNVMGSIVLVSKRDPAAFRLRHFLPDNFDKVLDAIRTSPERRLKRLGILPG